MSTTSGKGGWRAFKGKCNKCGKQGHKARDCNSHRNNEKRESGKTKIKCFNCKGFGHIAQECPRKVEKGMFVGMTIYGSNIREESFQTKRRQEHKNVLQVKECDNLEGRVMKSLRALDNYNQVMDEYEREESQKRKINTREKDKYKTEEI
jgi:hypothetical protein